MSEKKAGVESSVWWSARMEEHWSCSLKKFKEILFIKEMNKYIIIFEPYSSHFHVFDYFK